MSKRKFISKKSKSISLKRKIRYLHKISKNLANESNYSNKIHYEMKPKTNESVKFPPLTKSEEEKKNLLFAKFQKRIKGYYQKEKINFLIKMNKNQLKNLEEKERKIPYVSPNEPIYKYFDEKDRLESLFTITNIFNELPKYDNSFHFGRKLLFQVFRLLDFTLSKIHKKINHDDLFYLMYSSLYIISKSKFLPALSSLEFYGNCLNDFDVNNLLKNQSLVLLYSNGDINPIKSLDFFPIIMFNFKRQNQGNEIFRSFFQVFENTYYDINYMTLFNYEVSLKIPSIVFVVSVYITNDNIKNISGEYAKYCDGIQTIMTDFMKELNYPKCEYSNTELTLRKAIESYNEERS